MKYEIECPICGKVFEVEREEMIADTHADEPITITIGLNENEEFTDAVLSRMSLN